MIQKDKNQIDNYRRKLLGGGAAIAVSPPVKMNTTLPVLVGPKPMPNGFVKSPCVTRKPATPATCH